MATSKPLKKSTTPAAAPTTAVAVRKPTAGAVQSMKEAIAAQAAAMSDRIAPPGGSKIKLAAGKMTLPDGTVTSDPIDVVVVDFTSRNMFYEGDYDASNITPPACFAIGSNPLKLVPSPNAPLPQAKTCAECPMNQFGSGGKGKACKNERLLAVLPPDAEPDAPIWTMSVSPGAIKGFDGYVANVLRTFQTPPFGVITTVSLNPNVSYPSLVFGDAKPNANISDHFARQVEAQGILAVEPDVSAFGVEKAPPAKATPTRGRAPVRR